MPQTIPAPDRLDEFEAYMVAGPWPAVLPPPPRWMRRAACAGMDVDTFFPEGQGAQPTRASDVCDACPVQRQCLAWAVEHDEDGVWGGTTRKERKAMERRPPTETEGRLSPAVS